LHMKREVFLLIAAIAIIILVADLLYLAFPNVPAITSWSDVFLIVLFGIPVAIRLYSRFFVKPKLTAHAFTSRGTAYIGIENNGKTAQSLEAALGILDTSPLESLYWELPTGRSLVAERLPKWGRLRLPIAHLTEPRMLNAVGAVTSEPHKKAGRWEIRTAETKDNEGGYSLEPNKEYECGLYVYYMPSATGTWTFKISANDKGELHCSEPEPMA
jgi:hypothetical protein